MLFRELAKLAVQTALKSVIHTCTNTLLLHEAVLLCIVYPKYLPKHNDKNCTDFSIDNLRVDIKPQIILKSISFVSQTLFYLNYSFFFFCYLEYITKERRKYGNEHT